MSRSCAKLADRQRQIRGIQRFCLVWVRIVLNFVYLPLLLGNANLKRETAETHKYYDRTDQSHIRILDRNFKIPYSREFKQGLTVNRETRFSGQNLTYLNVL